MKMRRSAISVAILLLAPGWSAPGVAIPQDKPEAKDAAAREFQEKVDAAVDKGVQWMLDSFKTGGIPDPSRSELVCLTLVHAGVRRDHPFLVDQINRVLNQPLRATYNAGVRALLMEALDRKHFQNALAETAAFFVDSQCDNGQWTYSGKSHPIRATYTPTPGRRQEGPDSRATRTDDDGIAPGRPMQIPPQGKRSGVRRGDNSNAQYAILGLFAAARANCVLPKDTLERSVQWWESKQNADGGWGYQVLDDSELPGSEITTNASTGSMTTAGLTALFVCKFYLGRDAKGDAKIQKGLDWLGKNLTYSDNPRAPRSDWHFYYLYGLERVGHLSGLKEIGGKDWYQGGATWLIDNQKQDGHWGPPLSPDVTDTCFAILFLRRSTPGLEKLKDVVTEDPRKKKD